MQEATCTSYLRHPTDIFRNRNLPSCALIRLIHGTSINDTCFQRYLLLAVNQATLYCINWSTIKKSLQNTSR